MKRILLLLGLLSIAGACANSNRGVSNHGVSKEPASSPVAAPNVSGSGNDEGSKSSESTSTEVTKESAVRIAQTHLALKKASWGTPVEVAEREGKFYVAYETPEREMKLIGSRVIVVDKATGIASFQKRR